MYRTVVDPVLAYGNESWISTREAKPKLQRVAMKNLRAALRVRFLNDFVRTERTGKHHVANKNVSEATKGTTKAILG